MHDIIFVIPRCPGICEGCVAVPCTAARPVYGQCACWPSKMIVTCGKHCLQVRPSSGCACSRQHPTPCRCLLWFLVNWPLISRLVSIRISRHVVFQHAASDQERRGSGELVETHSFGREVAASEGGRRTFFMNLYLGYRQDIWTTIHYTTLYSRHSQEQASRLAESSPLFCRVL